MSGYDVNHSPALEGCRDRCARLEAENAELRAAAEQAEKAIVDVLAYHHHVLSKPNRVALDKAIARIDDALAATEGSEP